MSDKQQLELRARQIRAEIDRLEIELRQVMRLLALTVNESPKPIEPKKEWTLNGTR